MKEKGLLKSLTVANLPRDVLLSQPKISEQWGCFLDDELSNYLETTCVMPQTPRTQKFNKYFPEADVDIIQLFPHQEIMKLCKNARELYKYGQLLPSDWERFDVMCAIRQDMLKPKSKHIKEIWRKVQDWKWTVFFANKKTYVYGWLKNDGTKPTFQV